MEELNGSALIEVKSLKKYFPIEEGMWHRIRGYIRAVDGVSFSVRKGNTLGLVGESGCGKTTLGRSLLRAIEPTAGQVLFRDGGEDGGSGGFVDLARLSKGELRKRRKNLQMIFQDPYSSLDPRMTVLDIIGEPLIINKLARGRKLRDRVRELAGLVGLDVKHIKRYPHAFSGGQRQRIGIARALATNPQFIVADEPVSALDVSVQAQILNLLLDLQQEFGLTYLFIAHDLSVIKYISDRVAVMYVGKLVETAETEEIFRTPHHPYTEALLSAVSVPDPTSTRQRIILSGEAADPGDPPSGCYFHPRCRYAEEVCKEERPQLRETAPDHRTACHFVEKLDLSGVAV